MGPFPQLKSKQQEKQEENISEKLTSTGF